MAIPPFAARRWCTPSSSWKAGAGGVLLRIQPQRAARSPLGRLDIRVRDARRRDALGCAHRTGHAGVFAARREGPFANHDPRNAQITLAHLLTHTSGWRATTT